MHCFFMNRWALFIFFILRQLHENTIQRKIIFANAFIMPFSANYPITWLWNINIHSRELLKICLVLQNFAHQSPLLKLREMLQRLTECVYQRKAKTAEHLSFIKSIVQVLCIWESHTLDWTVYISRWLFWSKGLLWRSAYIWPEDRKTDVIVHPSILGSVFAQWLLMKKSFYFAWRQENFVHPSLMCNNSSLMKMYRCSVEYM